MTTLDQPEPALTAAFALVTVALAEPDELSRIEGIDAVMKGYKETYPDEPVPLGILTSAWMDVGGLMVTMLASEWRVSNEEAAQRVAMVLQTPL